MILNTTPFDIHDNHLVLRIGIVKYCVVTEIQNESVLRGSIFSEDCHAELLEFTEHKNSACSVMLIPKHGQGTMDKKKNSFV